MRLTSEGNVGIGTTSPETPLHVLSNTTDNASTMLVQNGSTGDASIKFNVSGDTYSIGIDNSDGDKFKLSYGAVGTNDRIVVDSLGNVGIGTTSPIVKLDVVGTARFADVSPRIVLQETGTAKDFSLKINTDGRLSFLNDDLSSEVLTIKQDGKVGIGTTSPSAALEVVGGIKLSDNSPLTWATSNTRIFGQSGYMQLQVASGDVMRLTSAGDVGIGVTTPRAKLDVAGGVKVADDTDTAGANKVGTLRYRTSGNNSYVDMCMQTGASTYAWINVVQNNW
jgi:hypothetical protein